MVGRCVQDGWRLTEQRPDSKADRRDRNDYEQSLERRIFRERFGFERLATQ